MDIAHPKPYQLLVRFTRRQRQQLEELAADYEVSRAEVIRLAVRQLHTRTFLPARPSSEVHDDA